MSRRFSKVLGLVLVAGILVSCSEDQQTAGIDRGGMNPVAMEGPITGFGSIFVNGVRFDVGSAQINVNGMVMTESDLAIGQIVSISGDLDADGVNATADSVAFDANVIGRIDAIDIGAEILVVLGQFVQTDGATVFELGSDPAVLGSLAVGDVVAVSGFVGAGGAIVATWVERGTWPEHRVRGTAANVDTATRRFSINDLTLDYSAAFLVENFPSGEPADGDDVIAVGSAFGASGELLVEQLRLRDRVDDGAAGDEAEIEGLITRFVSPSDFDVAGVPVTTLPSTVYEGGAAADLTLNVKVQAEGTLDANGVIVADKIEVKDGGRVY